MLILARLSQKLTGLIQKSLTTRHQPLPTKAMEAIQSLTDIKSSVAVDGYIPKPKFVRVKEHSEKYNKKAYEKAREKGHFHCDYCDVDVLEIRKKQHLKTMKHELAVANSEVKPEDLLISQLVALATKLRNEFNITPELVWNNINPTMRILVDEASVKNCENWEHIDAEKIKRVCINEDKPIVYLNERGCTCENCEEAPKPKKKIIKKKPLKPIEPVEEDEE